MGMLRAGKSDQDVVDVFASQPRMEKKIVILRSFVASAPPKKEFDCLMQIMRTRNEYLHYNWEGRPQAKIDLSFKGIVALIKRAEPALDGLLQYEHEEFDLPFMSLATRLFPAAR